MLIPLLARVCSPPAHSKRFRWRRQTAQAHDNCVPELVPADSRPNCKLRQAIEVVLRSCRILLIATILADASLFCSTSRSPFVQPCHSHNRFPSLLDLGPTRRCVKTDSQIDRRIIKQQNRSRIRSAVVFRPFSCTIRSQTRRSRLSREWNGR